ncbi:hypothetical protein [Pseudothermotoga sp.]
MIVVSLVVAAFAAVKISVLCSPDNADALKWLAGEFMKQNPDIQVEIVLLSLHHFEGRWSRPKTGDVRIFPWH